MTIQALREQRAVKAKALHELVNKADWNQVNDQPLYDAGIAELDEIDARIANIVALNERAAADAVNGRLIEGSLRAARDNNSSAAAVFAKWLCYGDRSLNDAERSSVFAAMSTTTQSEGGYTVQTEIASTVLEALKQFGGMRAVANVIVTTNGAPMQFPTSDGTSDEGEIVAENATAGNRDISFGTISLPVYKYSSMTITVPVELLQDSQTDIEALVRNRLVTSLGRITNKHFTVGTGSSQPRGIVTAATTGVTAANGTSQVTAVKYDSLVDLQHSVDPAYREMGNCRWMFNDSTLKALRKVVDGQSRPIFVPGYETGNPAGAPDRLLGYPIQINQNFADMGASAKSIAFGDFRYYTIRDAMGIEIQRYTDSAFARKGQVGFQAWLRSGGNFVDVGGAVKLFVNAAS